VEGAGGISGWFEFTVLMVGNPVVTLSEMCEARETLSPEAHRAMIVWLLSRPWGLRAWGGFTRRITVAPADGRFLGWSVVVVVLEMPSLPVLVVIVLWPLG
jgi:hypothetical protein